jgi:hypothetical protein
MTDDCPASAGQRIEAARLKELDPQGALRVDDQLEAVDLGIFEFAWSERQL